MNNHNEDFYLVESWLLEFSDVIDYDEITPESVLFELVELDVELLHELVETFEDDFDVNLDDIFSLTVEDLVYALSEDEDEPLCH